MPLAYNGGRDRTLEDHFRLFNDAVRSQDRTAFLAAFPAAFTPDAVMTFNGAAVTVTFDE